MLIICTEVVEMLARIEDLRDKEVICISDGTKVGYVCDVEIDCDNAKLVSLLVYGRLKFFGFLGREDDYIIPWTDIAVIGDDTILVNFKPDHKRRKSTSILAGLFEIK